MTDRIKLTKEVIDSIIGLFCYESEYGELQGENKRTTDIFIKQILDDNKFREKHDRRFDGLFSIKELREENKQLKEESNNLKFRLVDEQDEINRINGEWRRDKKKLEKIKELSFHAGCNGNNNCVLCPINKIFGESGE